MTDDRTLTIRVRLESMGTFVVEQIDPETHERARSTIAVRCANIAQATDEIERKLHSLKNRGVRA